MKKSLESVINIICNLFIFIAMLFGFYFLVMLKLIKINPENLSNYFGGSDADVALWNIWNILSSRFTIIFLIVFVLGLGLYFLKFHTEEKNISESLSGIIIKSIIMIVIIKSSRFLLGVLVDYTTHLENNQGASIEYSTTLYN